MRWDTVPRGDRHHSPQDARAWAVIRVFREDRLLATSNFCHFLEDALEKKT